MCHEFQHRGKSFTVFVERINRTHWRARWSVLGGPSGGDLSDYAPTETVALEEAEYEARRAIDRMLDDDLDHVAPPV